MHIHARRTEKQSSVTQSTALQRTASSNSFFERYIERQVAQQRGWGSDFEPQQLRGMLEERVCAAEAARTGGPGQHEAESPKLRKRVRTLETRTEIFV